MDNFKVTKFIGLFLVLLLALLLVIVIVAEATAERCYVVTSKDISKNGYTIEYQMHTKYLSNNKTVTNIRIEVTEEFYNSLEIGDQIKPINNNNFIKIGDKNET